MPQADKKWISHPNVLLLQTVKARFSGTRVSIAVCACCATTWFTASLTAESVCIAPLMRRSRIHIRNAAPTGEALSLHGGM